MTSSINLFVAQLDKRVDDELLKVTFEKFGSVISAIVAKDEYGDSKGYGFVHFNFMSDGLRAMKEMNGQMLLSRTICVNLANKQDDDTFYNGGDKPTAVWASEWNIQSTKSSDSDDFSDNASEASFSSVRENRSSESSDLQQRMLKLFESQMYTDVVFYPKNDHKTSISAHRSLLAIGSPLFADMLFGEKSKNTIGMKMEVEISNLPFDAFKRIVKYLYTDEIILENDVLAQAILDGAKQFKIHLLVDKCKMYFESQTLTEQNVCSKFQMSISGDIEVLKKRCIDYIESNTWKVIRSPDFGKCSFNTIFTICKLQSFNLKSEKELLDAVMKWLNQQQILEKKQLTESLLKCFRLLTFTATEFGDVMKMYPDLLTSDDGLQIMLYLYNPPKAPDFKSLPYWLNKNYMKRCNFVENPYDTEIRNNPTWEERSATRKVIFSLKSANDNFIEQNMTELTSLLQMKCVKGFHVIKAIKLSFQAPESNESVIGSIIIKVHVSPSGFYTFERIAVANSVDVQIPFKKVIKARRGDLLDIEVEARDFRNYKFLQFDETLSMSQNPHFECCVSSRPKCGKLYFISEVEYDSQDSQDNQRFNFRPNAGKPQNKHFNKGNPRRR